MGSIQIQACSPEHEHYLSPFEDPKDTLKLKRKMLEANTSDDLFLGIPNTKKQN